ncbi:hypothetical protein C1645_734950 [Glomus cerebriforme]|uniref:Uncharacterized protein n=1 Tax=Glomus cerebriforme TaxID=658196 RepID=A0A397T7J7_9GLOM|nr:hypothetical protein C1645_734950 [Glomus cerebriforme]
MGINISTEEVAIFEGFGAKQVQEQDATLLAAEQLVTLTNQYIEAEKFAKHRIEELSNKLQETITDRNTLKNAYGEKQPEILLRETGYYESKAHYADPNESDCASSIINDSEDESMTESLTNRFRNMEIPQSVTARGKRPVGVEDEPIETKENNKNGRSLNNSIHATKKKIQHEEKQSFHKHVLGVNCAASGVTNEGLEQMIKEDMISSNISYEQIKEIFVNHNNHMTVTVAQLKDANKIMMTDHGRKYKYVKLYELNQTIGHTKILLKNVSKHVTKEMIKEAVEGKIGTVGKLNYKVNEVRIDVEVEVEVQIPDQKFKEMWSIGCNGYRIEVQQIQTVSERMLKNRRRFFAKIKNLPPNSTDQQLEGELLPRHAKHWKVYNVNDHMMEGLVLFESAKDRNIVMKKNVKVNNKEYIWWSSESTQYTDRQNPKYRTFYCGICKRNNHNTQDCFYNNRKVEKYCSICKRSNHTTRNCFYNNANRSSNGNTGRKVTFQNRSSSTQYRNDEGRRFRNNDKQQFFHTEANRTPINRPRVNNRSGSERTNEYQGYQRGNGRQYRRREGKKQQRDWWKSPPLNMFEQK